MDKDIITCLAFLLISLDLGLAKATCYRGNTTYHLSTDRANYFQAFINCKNGKMELASAEDEAESNALDAYLNPYKIEGFANGFWISGTNLNNITSKQYYWLATGNKAIFTNWVGVEPNDFLGLEHCITWVMFEGTVGWADDKCEGVYRYVCEDRSLDMLLNC